MIKEDIYGFETEYSFFVLPNGLHKFDYPKKDNSYKVLYLARTPSFDLVSRMLEEATYINHITGEPFVRTSLLYREIFTKAIVSVNFQDNDLLEEIDVSKADLSKINYNLVKIICKDYMRGVL